MIRVVLAVLVAVALLAAAAPALEDARATTTAERLDTEADRVERAVGGLVSGSVSVADPSLAARTTVTVRAPSGFGAAPDPLLGWPTAVHLPCNMLIAKRFWRARGPAT